MGQGRDQAKTFLKEHAEVMTELRNKVLSMNGIGQLLMSTPESNAEGSESEALDEETPKSKSKSKTKH
jgi:hypothetical protein